jgi:hypothetical protein
MKTHSERWQPPIIFLLALVVTACSTKPPIMPSTYPVSGRVVTEKGKPYAGGSLQFQPESKEDLTVRGDIDKDGNFHLHTLKGSQRADGAPAGTYQVTIFPALGPDRKAPFASFIVPKKYQIEAKENELEIRTDPPVR